jgi:hypothetical protein
MSDWFWCRSGHQGASVRLYCVPNAGAGASTFYSWFDHAPSWLEVIAVQLPGREVRFENGRLTGPSLHGLRKSQQMVIAFRPVRPQHGCAPCGAHSGGTDGACGASSGFSGRRGSQRYRELRRLNFPKSRPVRPFSAERDHGELSSSEALHRAFTKARFRRLGLLSMEQLVSA